MTGHLVLAVVISGLAIIALCLLVVNLHERVERLEASCADGVTPENDRNPQIQE